MGFFRELSAATLEDQAALLDIPFVQRALEGQVSLETYQRFLTQAFHHVRHTVPLLMAAGSRLGPDPAWIQEALCEYIEEEQGHDGWILDDLETTGASRTCVEVGPERPCRVMVAYAYDQVQRRNPMGFFGMVHVLEGTSVRAATQAAQAMRESLGLPRGAFTYLESHGSLDQGHVAFFEKLMDRVLDPRDQREIVESAHTFFQLYGDIFRELSS